MNILIAVIAVIAVAIAYQRGVVLVCKILRYCGRTTPKPERGVELRRFFTADDFKPVADYTRADLEAYYRRGVEAAGGQYVGIQESEPFNLVLFNSLKTGSTLAVKEKDFSTTAVVGRLAQHESEWGID